MEVKEVNDTVSRQKRSLDQISKDKADTSFIENELGEIMELIEALGSGENPAQKMATFREEKAQREKSREASPPGSKIDDALLEEI